MHHLTLHNFDFDKNVLADYDRNLKLYISVANSFASLCLLDLWLLPELLTVHCTLPHTEISVVWPLKKVLVKLSQRMPF